MQEYPRWWRNRGEGDVWCSAAFSLSGPAGVAAPNKGNMQVIAANGEKLTNDLSIVVDMTRPVWQLPLQPGRLCQRHVVGMAASDWWWPLMKTNNIDVQLSPSSWLFHRQTTDYDFFLKVYFESDKFKFISYKTEYKNKFEISIPRSSTLSVVQKQSCQI